MSKKSETVMTDEGEAVANVDGGGTITRRSFLKILGSASAAAGVAGCTDRNDQNIFPNVRGEREQIPGVSVWYASTCGECSAGCGVLVRTREGRAVKLEGNPDSPINRGALCAMGQSALQNLYDPDRVRQPLSRDPSGKFVPISWDEAYGKVADALKDDGVKKAFLTGDTSGALDDLLNAVSTAFKAERVSYDALTPTEVARAAELVYGVYGIPGYNLETAETIVSFGADFLGTWVSPVEYSRGWIAARRREKPVRLVHLEPHLSVTAANADLWLSARPGTDAKIALAILKDLLAAGKGANVRDDIRTELGKLVDPISIDEVAAQSGVAAEKILLISHYLKESRASLVLSGGTIGATSEPLSLHLIVNFINLVLGNVGQTINLATSRTPQSSPAKLAALADTMRRGQLGALFIHGTNPRFNFPGSFGLDVALKTVPLVVSFSSHLDETTEQAHLILPVHTSIESWGDARPIAGVYSLRQPAMLPVFDTRQFGDMLIDLAKLAGQPAVSGGSANFEEYLKASWKKLQNEQHVPGEFDPFWRSSLERGGYFTTAPASERSRVRVAPEAISLAAAPTFEKVASFGAMDTRGDDLLLYPFATVHTMDGRGANRPWMQEIPDPITQVAWDGWVEIHPETAKARGLEKGDMVTIRNHFGELDLPVYITPYVHREVVAVPIGVGHWAYGRYAKRAGGGAVYGLLSDKLAKGADSVPLLSAGVQVMRGRGQNELCITQFVDSQKGRGLARMAFVGAAVEEEEKPTSSMEPGLIGVREGEGAGEHEKVKQMYVQRQHPLYAWGMAIDLTACTGCSACVVACYAENNLSIVGKKMMNQGREMSWLRIERYYEGGEGDLQVNFLPMLCQHCRNAPCEPVCPVYATYHNEEGLNVMVYNRCVGTRYCSNNCSYKVRRFNWFEYDIPAPLDWQLNPDVTKRSAGVMEKCTFCVQRIVEAKDRAKDLGRPVQEGEIQPACVQSCPTNALIFGDLNNPESRASKLSRDKRAYKVLDHHINTQPAISYLDRMKYKI